MTTYFTDGAASITLKPNGPRKGDGWFLIRSWRPEAHDDIWVATKREAEQAAAEHLKLRRAHVASVRMRVFTALGGDAARIAPELIDRLVVEFAK